MFTYNDNRVKVTFRNSTIFNNSNTLSGYMMASAVRVYVVPLDNALPNEIPKLGIVKTLFGDNRHIIGNVYIIYA